MRRTRGDPGQELRGGRNLSPQELRGGYCLSPRPSRNAGSGEGPEHADRSGIEKRKADGTGRFVERELEGSAVNRVRAAVAVGMWCPRDGNRAKCTVQYN